jgi:hypothetical protein
MNTDNTAKFLQELKKQLSAINYYVDNLQIIEKDRKSVANLAHVKQVLGDISYKLNRHISETERDMKVEKDAKTDDGYKISLATMNSPTKEMIFASEKNNLIRQSIMGSKTNIIKEAFANLHQKDFVKNYTMNLRKKEAMANEEKNKKSSKG